METQTKILNPTHFSEEAIQQYHDDFAGAHPYPHIVLDNFLQEDFAEELYNQFPTQEHFSIHWKGLNENKSEGSEWDKFPAIFRELNETVTSQEFCDWCARVTGIPGVFITDDNMGSGLHQGTDGSFLDIHVDFNMNTKKGVYRRLNMLIYLNKDWQNDWGGHFELWDPEMKNCEKKIAPRLNRCVIFETSDISYHGYGKIHVPEGITRNSFYAYFYTQEPGRGSDRYFDTTFRARPDEAASKRLKTDIKERIKNTVKGTLRKLGIKVYKI